MSENYMFRLSDRKKKDLIFSECIYYDVETAPWDDFPGHPIPDRDAPIAEDETEIVEDYTKYLNIRKCGICSMVIFLPKHLICEKRIEQLKNFLVHREIKFFDEVTFICLSLYDDKIRTNVRNALLQALDIIAGGLRKTAYLCGYNNSGFDDLIFGDRLSEDISCFCYHLEDGKETKLFTADLRYWAKSYGFPNLKAVGKYLECPKVEQWTNKEEYIEYNIQDVFIIPLFLKLLNSHGLFALRPATAARHRISSEMFSKFQQEEIVEIPADEKGKEPTKTKRMVPITRIFSDQKISDLIPLIGARTEPYHAVGKNLFYLDVNSLYPYTMVNFRFPRVIRGKTISCKNDAGQYVFYANGEIEHTKTTCGPFRRKEIQAFLDECSKYIRQGIHIGECFTAEKMRQLFEEKSPWYGVLKVKIKGIREEWKDYEQQLLKFFPFARKTGGYTLYSFDATQDYWIQFYELVYLCFFDYEIDEAVEYPYSAPFPLAEETKVRYEKRKELKAKGDAEEKAVKMLLNAGFGIFATRERVKRRIIEQNEQKRYMDLWKASGSDCSSFIIFESGLSWEEEKDNPNAEYKRIYVRTTHQEPIFDVETGDPNRRYGRNTIPIFAVAITSHARFSLYSYMLNGIFVPPELEENFRIFYVDTDSIFCAKGLFEQLLYGEAVGKELGQLKLENEIDKTGEPIPLKEAVFLAPKTYIAVGADGTPMKKMKGTGTLFTKNVVSQSAKSGFSSFTRTALRPEHVQKRRLEENLSFTATAKPEPGTATLAKLYEEVQKRYPDFKI